MQPTFLLTITQAGLDALVDAQNGETEAIVITELGLSEQHVTVAPTLEVLPGEFKRIDTVSGQSVSEMVIHMTAQDAEPVTYDVRAIGLFLADGTLFAAYSQADPIFRKVDIASFLFSVDVMFAEAVADDIEFGNANLLFPPASELVKGVAEIATQAEVDAGVDDERIVTPLKLDTRLAPVLQEIADEAAERGAADAALQAEIDAEELARGTAIAAIVARTITGAGLATGGGDLSASRIINVAAASAAEADAGVIATKALTPASLANILAAIAGKVGFGSATFGSNTIRLTLALDGADTLLIQGGTGSIGANSSAAITFPVAYSTAPVCIVDGGVSDAGEGDVHGTAAATTTGKAIANGADDAANYSWLAIGRA